MVVKPNELANKIRVNDERILKEFETKIDGILRDRYIPGQDVGVPFPDGVRNHQEFVVKIKTMYEKAGWEVRYRPDQKDGDYLNFQEKNSEVKKW